MNYTSKLIRLVRRIPADAMPAAARLRARLDSLEADARDHHGSEALRRRGLIHEAYNALDGDSFVLPADPEARAISEWLSSSPAPLRESCNGEAVELYVSTVVDSAVTAAAAIDEEFDAEKFETSRRRELDPEVQDLMSAERPFLLGKWLAEESRAIERLRSRDEQWELAIGLVVAGGLELTMKELGIEEEWGVGFSSEREGFFGWRDGVSTYAGLLLPGSDSEDPLGALATFVADRLDAVYLGYSDDGKAEPSIPKKASKRRGRPREYDAAADAKVADGWRNSGEKTLAAYALLIGLSAKNVKDALERHRKRRNKS